MVGALQILVPSPTKGRLYALVDAFEQDLTEYIRNTLGQTHYQEQLLSPNELAGVRERQMRDGELQVTESAEDDELIQWMYLWDKVQLLHRWKRELPSDEAKALSGLSEAFNGLNDLRRRSHHTRPLHSDDLENGMKWAAKISHSALPFERLRAVSRRIQVDENWIPKELVTEKQTRIIENIPPGDFDETGLVGRETERETLRRYLIEQTYRVVSVVAPGGYGKTALALQVLHDISDDPQVPYDVIAFVSLKTEQLTEQGIQAITDSVSSLDEALPLLLQPLSDEPLGSGEELAERLDGIRTLLVLDNLETVSSGSEIVDFVELMPSSVSFLFTSRVGIGELERRIPLPPLALSHGVHLMRLESRASQVDYMAKADQQELEGFVEQLNGLPLYIKWFVRSVAKGLDPMTVLANTEDLAEFCVAQLFGRLSPQAASATWALFALNKPVYPPTLLSCLDVDADESRRALIELTQHMFITQSADGISTQPRIQLSPLVRAYQTQLDTRGESDRSVMAKAREVEAGIQSEISRNQQDQSRGLIGPKVIRGGVQHNAARALLRQALHESRRDPEEALETIKQAEKIDISFWEVYRVRGYLLASQGQEEGVVQAYERALELAPEADKPYVKHYYSGFLSRTNSEEQQALGLRLAEEAVAAIDHPGFLFQYAIACQRNRKLDDSIQACKTVLANNYNFNLRKKVLTTLLNSYRRRADDLHDIENQPEEALQQLDLAVSEAQEAVGDGLSDEKLTMEMINLVSDVLKCARSVGDSSLALGTVVRAVRLYEAIRDFPGASRNSRWIEHHAGPLRYRHLELSSILSPILETLDTDIEVPHSSAERVSGYVVHYLEDKGYGFIKPSLPGDDLFFHVSQVIDPVLPVIEDGTPVSFEIGATDRGPCALRISSTPTTDSGPSSTSPSH